MSSRRDQRQVKARSKSDEEPMPLDTLRAPVRALLANTSESNSAGPRLHRCNGRALTPQENGPATSEREQDDERAQPVSTT